MSTTERPYWAKQLPEDEYAMAMRGLFGVEAAAAYIGTSVRFVRDLVAGGAIEARKVGRRLRIQKAQLDSYLGFT